MIKFELKCADGHRFEAWFRNGDTYEEQAAGGAIHCPTCGGTGVSKAPMAPRIARSGTRSRPEGEGRAPEAADAGREPADDTARMAALMRQLRELRSKVEATADNVGDRFAEEARKIHYGEVETRAIYGETTPEQAADLQEEGVPFARIPWVPPHNS